MNILIFENRWGVMAINWINLIYVLLGTLGGWVVATFLNRARARSLFNKAQEKLAHVEEEARGKRRELELERKEELHRVRAEVEKETQLKREELSGLSKRLVKKEEILDRRLEELEKDSKELLSKGKSLERDKEQIKILEDRHKKELERIAGISSEEAKRTLLENIKKGARQEANQIIQKVEREAKEIASRKAREIVSVAIQRLAVDQVVESTVCAVTLPNDEMKGRVIGREGRNIRTFEALTGVDLIVDDTPETVVISCFDPLRRKIAEVSLQRLISDTRIHPARIEEIVEKAKKDVEEIMQEEGRRTVFDMGISDLPLELVSLLGKLKFRTSYGQNVLEHSKEVSYIAGIMAAELGLEPARAKRAGLLHDIGKAVDQEVEGPHAVIGSHLVKRYGQDPTISHAVAAHHEDEPAQSTLAVLIQASDAISAARPGARREVLEAYLERLENLEKVATSFSGVDKAYAIQAGREVRIIVHPEQISDEEAERLSREISGRIEKELTYPGQIKVTVIREHRAVEYAK